ncbi:lumazine binding domain protein [Mycobacterium kansasii]|uniref:Riboflavin synthase n=1 Tax=Mycobacterium kansasii TaxID=1768 RepID=A0A1V3WDC0_MYCKA|nr:lumazine binding domain protein [Mycobacterium kansasii]
MFTGIVEELGEVIARDTLTDAARLTIRGPVVTSDAGHGDSIAVNGVCLTVVEVLPDGQFTADVMAETLNRSSLGDLRVGSRVNLERAAALNSRLGGTSCRGMWTGPARSWPGPRRSTGKWSGSRFPRRWLATSWRRDRSPSTAFR